MKKGYTNASALVGGTNAWKHAGYPMVGLAKTADPKAGEKKVEDKKPEKKS